MCECIVFYLQRLHLISVENILYIVCVNVTDVLGGAWGSSIVGASVRDQ